MTITEFAVPHASTGTCFRAIRVMNMGRAMMARLAAVQDQDSGRAWNPPGLAQASREVGRKCPNRDKLLTKTDTLVDDFRLQQSQKR